AWGAGGPDERIVRVAGSGMGSVARPGAVASDLDGLRGGLSARAVPNRRAVRVGVVELPVRVDELVAEGDPEGFEARAGLAVGTDPIGPDDEEDVGDDLGTVGGGLGSEVDHLASDRGH